MEINQVKAVLIDFKTVFQIEKNLGIKNVKK